jgi:hypothetical protein
MGRVRRASTGGEAMPRSRPPPTRVRWDDRPWSHPNAARLDSGSHLRTSGEPFTAASAAAYAHQRRARELKHLTRRARNLDSRLPPWPSLTQQLLSHLGSAAGVSAGPG